MNNTQRFLEAFRRLESALREASLTADGPREFSGMLSAAARHDSFVQRRFSELDLCRQIRNLLSHFPAQEGRSPIVPDESLVQVMEETIDHLEHPVRARDAAVARDKVYTVNRQSPLKQTMMKMRERGFSHVPVMDGRQVIAVFSIGTVFTAVCRGQVSDAQIIGDLLADIGLDDHENEQYAFVAADEPLTHVKALFQRRDSRRRKVALAFVTENGDRDEALLGILTPWDVLRALDD